MILDYCEQVTSKGRSWMEEKRAVVPTDPVEYPGKMDHTTCLAFKVPIATPQANILSSLFGQS